ncbi:MAG: YitT family protein [Pseudodesulfovibrio sp.]|nr:YitT family protein [Pseudodesulfovibrio sp.]
MENKLRNITDSLAWNLFLLAAGSFVYVIGYKGVAVHHDFVPGTLYGLAVVAQKIAPEIQLSYWYFLLNIPLFLVAWKSVSKRFFLLNLFSMIVVSILTSFIQLDMGIENEMYAAIVSGALMGAGCGIIFRSYGSGGGLDVIAVILNRKYGVRIGCFYLVVNLGVMLFALSRFTPDKIIVSFVMLFICSVVTEYVLALFNQRKAVRIMTKKPEELIEVMIQAKYPATIFAGTGGYTKQRVNMIFSITDNLRLRSLEQLVFDNDPEAIFVVENTFSVIGGSIARRKTY